MLHAQVALSVVALPGDGKEPPSAFRILKAGVNTSEKGEFIFDAAAAERVMAAYTAKGLDKIQIDYEHQSMVPPPGGGPAHKPAAGWFKPEVRGGELWATAVAWTAAALAMVAPPVGAPEYRYFSPILFFDQDTRQVTGLKNLALTNDPALDSLTPLAAATALNGKDTTMACEACSAKDSKLRDLEEKCTSLTAKLSAYETAEPGKKEAMTSLTAVRTSLCALTGQKTEDAALGVVEAWKKDAAAVAELRADAAKRETDGLEAQLTALVDGAIKAGKVTPAEKETTVAMAKGDDGKISKSLLTKLTAFLGAVQPKVKLTTIGEPAQGALGGQAIEEMNRKMGVDGKAFAEWQAKQGLPAA